MYDKFKGLLADDALFYGLLILFVALASFGLGRLSVTESSPESSENTIVMSHNESARASEALEKYDAKDEPVDTVSSSFVASKNGTKYHALWCPGASQIKEENKIYFATKEAAEAAGYTPAANCKGI